MQFFDPTQSFAVVERKLPHWSQPGAIAFVTWRTWDSIPASVLEQWVADRCRWLSSHGIDPTVADWRRRVDALDATLRKEFHDLLCERWEMHLDSCHGECTLRDPVFSKSVSRALLHFDGVRYQITDFVVMPNHVHLLAAFPDEAAMLSQCESWKRYTATIINRMLGRKGRFWQQDGFDRLIRSQEQFDFRKTYIAENPDKAKLKAGEYIHYSRR